MSKPGWSNNSVRKFLNLLKRNIRLDSKRLVLSSSESLSILSSEFCKAGSRL